MTRTMSPDKLIVYNLSVVLYNMAEIDTDAIEDRRIRDDCKYHVRHCRNAIERILGGME